MPPRSGSLLLGTAGGKPFTIPTSAVSHTFAMLAMRGAGKSNALVRLAETMAVAGLPWVAIDPKGDWWGIRSSKDGTKPGLSIYIFGGLHGDVPLEPSAGTFMADLVFDHNLTCLLDVSQFSKGEQVRFLAEFAERLFRRHQSSPTPRHVFMEEAEEYLPQQFSTRESGGYMARCVGAWSKLVKQGRAFGLGMTMATQRSASLNKNALTQVESLIVLRTPAPQDQDAIEKWVRYHSVSGEIMKSLSSLDDGEAWIISPHVLRTVERITFSRRTTFDSGATPTLGQVLPSPSSYAEIDLDKIKQDMAATIERVEATDPKKLQARVRSLEIQLRQAVDELAKPREAPEPERIEVPVLDKDQQQVIFDVLGRTADVRTALESLEGVSESIYVALNRIQNHQAMEKFERQQVKKPAATKGGYPAGNKTAAEIKPPPASVTRRPLAAVSTDARTLTKAERQVLSCLATMRRPLTSTQISQLTGRSHKSSAYKNALSSLRTSGYITRGADIEATNDGLGALGDEWEALPSPGRDLVEWWKANHLGKSEKAIIDFLVSVYPSSTGKEEISESTGYSLTSSGFKNALSRMRSFALIEGYDEIRVAPALMGDM